MKKILKFNDFIREEADYRNVTGNGSMGSPDPQNSGPSFNKGPDSATYGRPDVIGVERDTIEDPYFGQSKEQKKKRARKHPYIEKKRKEESKYLMSVDEETLDKRVDENLLDPTGEPLKKLREITQPVLINSLIKDLTIEESITELNRLFKDKWVNFRETAEKYPYLFCKVEKFWKKANANILGVLYSEAYDYDYDESFSKFDASKFYVIDKHDYITKLKKYEVKQLFNESDPMGEEDWDDGNQIS